MNKLKQYIPYLLVVLTIAGAAIRLNSCESEVLYRSQELGLWLPTETYWNTLSIYPGGGLSWLGALMTTFFYEPAMGVSLLAIAWIAITILCIYRFRLKGAGVLLSLLPVMMIVAALTQTGYWLFYQKTPGHMWLPTLAVLLSLVVASLTSALTRLTSKDGKPTLLSEAIRYVVMIGVAWAGYIYMGAWSFLAVTLIALPTDHQKSSRKQWITSHSPLLVATLLIAAVPQIAYRTVFEQTSLLAIYTAGMPCFHYSSEDISIYRWAYYLLALSFIPMAAMPGYNRLTTNRKWSKWLGAVMLVVLLGGGAYFVNERWFDDKNYHAEVKMLNACDRNDWEDVLTTMLGTATDTVQPTRAMVMMKNLALTRVGRIGDEMLLYPEGSRQQNAEWSVRMTQIVGKMLYYNYGKLNFAYRWCMEDGVEFGWTVEQLKILARCSMLKGEDKVAHKYFDLLKLTRNHKEWAEHYESFIGQPEKMRENEELRPITYLKEYGNRLDSDNTLIELYLLQTFANGHGADPVYQEQTLISALLMKDIQLFWPRLFEYANMHSNEKDFHMPRYFQEAAYLYGHLEHDVDISQMPFDQSVKTSYERFMAFNDRPDINPLSEEQKKVVFKPLFGDTFYYFYFLVRGQKTN